MRSSLTGRPVWPAERCRDSHRLTDAHRCKGGLKKKSSLQSHKNAWAHTHSQTHSQTHSRCDDIWQGVCARARAHARVFVLIESLETCAGTGHLSPACLPCRQMETCSSCEEQRITPFTVLYKSNANTHTHTLQKQTNKNRSCVSVHHFHLNNLTWPSSLLFSTNKGRFGLLWPCAVMVVKVSTIISCHCIVSSNLWNLCVVEANWWRVP